MSLAHNRHVGLDLIYMIYVRDNVVAQNAGHYRVNKPRQGGPRCEAEVSCFALKDIIFGNDRQRSIHYYTATCQNSREIVRKRRWRRLETGRAGVDNWPDYLRSNKKDLNQAKNPLSLAAVKFRMHKSTDWPIAKYCSCWCHLSKLKNPPQTNRNKCIHVDYSGLHQPYYSAWNYIPIRELYSDWAVYRIIFYSDWAVFHF